MEDKPVRSPFCPFALFLLVLVAFDCDGQSTNVSVTAVPPWVRLCEWNTPTNQATAHPSEASRYLLYEQQEAPQQKESFTRVVSLMENQSGVQESGSLKFGFDPAFQELLLHRVEIHRDGKALNRLDRTKIKIIQPEPGLGGHIFTGKQTAVLFVEDLRVGDALEYAYTIRGENPIVGDHFSFQFLVQSSSPVDRQRLRIVWASARPLYQRQHQTEAQPSKEPLDVGTVYLWDFANLEAIPYEDDQPGSYEPYPYIELSDFQDWSSVVEWALPLYSVESTNPSPELNDLVTKWQQSYTSNEERALAALNFVQEELRYTGIELGPDSYRPARPGETIRLRYGDCKAKALLLCTLLRQMNLEAFPALVNTYRRDSIAGKLPSPFAFNHAIVKMLLDGEAIWIDPTRSHQGGRLRERYLPRYAKALVVKSGTAALEDIPPSGAKILKHVTSVYQLKDYESPALLTVTTTYYGSEADGMRSYLADTDPKEISKNYLNFYAGYYPGIHESRPLKITDRAVPDVIEVIEQYDIRDIWKPDKSSGQLEASFYPDNLQNVLTHPDTRLRKMPLSIPYPLRREQEIVVHLPDDEWTIPSADHTIESGAFTFHFRRQFANATVRLHYDCETKTVALPVEKVADHLKQLGEMEDLLGDTLYRPDIRAGTVLAQINWLMVVVAGFGLGSILVAGVWFWRTTRLGEVSLGAGLTPPLPDEEHLQGLGGWLYLVGFGLCLTLVKRPFTMVQHWKGYFSTAVWQAAAVPGGAGYHPLFGPLLIFELLGNTLMLGLAVLALCLFFTKRRAFPKIYIALMVGNALLLLVDEIVGSKIPAVADGSHTASMSQAARAVLQVLIWCSYMLKSRRVKLTFVR